MIRGYIGRIGSGKTLNMVKDAIQYLKAGKTVYTNVPFHYTPSKKDAETLFPIVLNSQAETEKTILTAQNCLICIDEAAIVFSSYFFKSMTIDYMMRFAQARKFNNDIFWASQGFKHVLKRIRDLTNEVVKCKTASIFGKKIHFSGCYEPEVFEYNLWTNPQQLKNYQIRPNIPDFSLPKYYPMFDTYHVIKYSAIGDQLKKTTSTANRYD